jgi:hypothetical protein
MHHLAYWCRTCIIADIDSVELNANQLAKKLTILEAIHMLTTAWKNVKQQTIGEHYNYLPEEVFVVVDGSYLC